MKRGWWKLQIDVKIGDTAIDFDELSAESKRKIMKMIYNGCVAGEVVESDEWQPAGCEEDEDEDIPLF